MERGGTRGGEGRGNRGGGGVKRRTLNVSSRSNADEDQNSHTLF